MIYINREGWMSRTMNMVEAVMAQHGFVDDHIVKQSPRRPAADHQRRGWIGFLASLLRRQKPGVHLAGKPIPQ